MEIPTKKTSQILLGFRDVFLIETTKRLREFHGKALPKVVAMTAYSMQHDRERFLSEGMDDYVPKPIRAAILLQKVNELVSNDKINIIEKVVLESPAAVEGNNDTKSPINTAF